MRHFGGKKIMRFTFLEKSKIVGSLSQLDLESFKFSKILITTKFIIFM
jgi:hypothetical protein